VAKLLMKVARQFVVVVVALALLFGAGCAQKPPQLPAQAKVPAEPIPTPLPVEITELTPPPAPAPTPQVETPPPEEPKAKPAQHRKRKTTQPVTTAQNNPPAAAPEAAGNAAPNANPGTSTMATAHPPANPASAPPADTAIAADVTRAQLSRQKQTTAQLLEDTGKTLSSLNRPLSHDEEGIVAQIRSYVTQSVSATKDGDFERAYNLATKAHLLSAALVKK
jgi:hypothetical protein